MFSRILILIALTAIPAAPFLGARAQNMTPINGLSPSPPSNMSLPVPIETPPSGCPAEEEEKKEGEKKETLTGTAVVQESNLMIVGGRIVSLWGISALAPDQQCWQGDAAWGCGQQATFFLRHFLEGWPLSCEIREKPENAPALVTCSRQREETKEDVAAALVRLGWALADTKTEGAPYAEEEAKARTEKRGIWGSRFQTAEDWEEGVQRFIGEVQGAQQETAPNK